MHHPALRRALLVEDREHLVVGVPVVDDQGLVEPFRQVDVPAERLHLGRPPVLAGPEVVQSGLPTARTLSCARASASISASASSSVPASACRGASLGCSATPATRASYDAAACTAQRAPGQVAADLHDPGDTDVRGGGQRLVGGEPVVAVGDVEVAVVVDHGVRQRLGCGWALAVAAPPDRSSVPARARVGRPTSGRVMRSFPRSPPGRGSRGQRLGCMGGDPVGDALEHPSRWYGASTHCPLSSMPARPTATSPSLHTSVVGTRTRWAGSSGRGTASRGTTPARRAARRTRRSRCGTARPRRRSCRPSAARSNGPPAGAAASSGTNGSWNSGCTRTSRPWVDVAIARRNAAGCGTDTAVRERTGRGGRPRPTRRPRRPSRGRRGGPGGRSAR